MDNNTNYYFVDFTFSTCHFQIQVNEIPVITYRDGGSVSTRMYINQFIEPGKNAFTCKMIPMSADGFEAVTLGTLKIGCTRNGEEKILTEASYTHDVKTPVPFVGLAGSFECDEAQLKPGLWQQNTIGQPDPQKMEILLAAFARLLGHFRKRDVDNIMLDARAKDEHFINRFHFNAAERLAYNRKFFAQKFQDDSWQVPAYFDNQYQLKYYSGEKLYSFELPNGNSPVEMVHALTNQKISIPVFFTFHEDKPVWAL